MAMVGTSWKAVESLQRKLKAKDAAAKCTVE